MNYRFMTIVSENQNNLINEMRAAQDNYSRKLKARKSKEEFNSISEEIVEQDINTIFCKDLVENYSCLQKAIQQSGI